MNDNVVTPDWPISAHPADSGRQRANVERNIVVREALDAIKGGAPDVALELLLASIETQARYIASDLP